MSFGASAQAVAHIRSYAEAELFLAEKGVDSRKVCGDNTYVERRDGGTIAIRLHQTDIITFSQRGDATRIILNTDGWHTLITKQRLEQFLPAPLTLYSFKGQWRIGLKDGQRWATTKADNAHSVVFTDGLILLRHDDGSWEPLNALTDAAEEKLNAAKRELDKAVKAYCKKLAAKLPEWAKEVIENNSLNVAGDPWCCTMGIGGGDLDHFWTHLKDGYVFPTIVVRAFEDSGRWEGGGMTAAQRAVTHIAYGWDSVPQEVAKYLRKKLDPFANPEAAAADPKSNAALERYTETAKDVLQKPEDFGYFGGDTNLWAYSAPTFTKHRDSDNIALANFEIVWNTLKEEFPDLVQDVDDEGYVSRDFNAWPRIYVFGAGHWAVGHIDQIVVPVVKDRDRPVGPTNLHPAFIRVTELAEQVKLYPALPGAEERASEMDRTQIESDVKSWIEYLVGKGETQLAPYTDEIVGYWVQHEDEYQWGSDDVHAAHIQLTWDEAHAPLPGQGVLI